MIAQSRERGKRFIYAPPFMLPGETMEALRELMLVGIFGLVIFALFYASSSSLTGAASALPQDTCKDSDNGIAIDVRGTISGRVNSESYRSTDECSADALSLQEFYCDGSEPTSLWVRCAAYCSQGACK